MAEKNTVYAGGLARHDTVKSGGTQYDYGVTSVTLIFNGGAEYVYSGGVDSASYMGSGGNEYVSKGGLARADEVASGGAQYDYGVTSGTLILKGGAEDILSGGVDYYATVYGSEVVSSGGMAHSATVKSGGRGYTMALPPHVF